MLIKSYRLIGLSIIFLLVGCGFHLRGMIAIPPWLNHVALINQEEHTVLAAMIKQQFEDNHVKVQSASDAPYWLILYNETLQEQIVSVSSSSTPRQYQLIYMVQFKLQTRQGGELLPLNQVMVTRQLTVNNDRILSNDSQQAIIKREMQREAAVQILNRLSRCRII